MPGHVVFDEAARRAGPLNGIVGTPNDYVWSADNSAEVQAGWIKRADTPEQLGALTGAPELAATLRGYGAQPDEFGRAPETLVALEPPLYAIQMQPGVATASGGARHDDRARVTRSDGTPIPGLYAAGAAGSIWGHLTEHGGGLTDAIVFGRIAGGGGRELGLIALRNQRPALPATCISPKLDAPRRPSLGESSLRLRWSAQHVV